MDNVHFNGLFYNTMPNASSSTVPQCVKSDPNLFKDDVDIRFSKTFNTCKVWCVLLGMGFLRYAILLFIRSPKFDMRRRNVFYNVWQIWDFSTLIFSTRSCWRIESSLMELLSLRHSRMCFSNPNRRILHPVLMGKSSTMYMRLVNTSLVFLQINGKSATRRWKRWHKRWQQQRRRS